MHATRTDYNAPVDPADVAGQIQRVHDRRHQGNRLVVPPVTYWRGFYTTEVVWFVSNTYPPVLAEVLEVEHFTLGPFDTQDRKAFTIGIRGDGPHGFYRPGERIDRVSANQLRKVEPEDVYPTEWSADHVPLGLADTKQGDVLADGVTAANE